MKKYLLTLLAIVLSSLSYAQGIQINGYSNYVFDDRVDSYYDPTSYYNGTIKGGFQWGAGIEYRANPYYGIEIMYLRQDTKAPLNYYQGGVKYTNFDLAVSHIMLGGKRYFTPADSKVDGYGGLVVGANVMGLEDPDSGRSGSKTFFAWGARLGADIWVTEKVAIKLQMQLISSTQSVGGGLYFGTGGASAGLTSYSSIYQFGMGGGLVLNLAK